MLLREKSVTGSMRGLSVVSKNAHNTGTRTFDAKFLNYLNNDTHLKQKCEVHLQIVVGQKQNIPPKTSGNQERRQQNMNRRSSKYNRKQYEQLRFLPRGLVNIGNTCYMNATLQCLFHLKYFTSSFLEQIKNYNHYHKQLPSVTHYSVSALKSMLEKGDPLQLRKLKQSIEFKQSMFKGYSQQDAQQFLTKLLQILNKQLSRVNKKCQYKQLDGDPSKKPINLLSDQWWSYSLKRQNSVICDVFQGQLISTIKCSHCRQISVNFDNFRGFPITLAKNASVHDLLIKQLNTQKLGEGYFCSGCKKDNCCNKLIEMFRLPKILVIQLKRFKSQADQYFPNFRGFSAKKAKINQSIKIDSTMNIGHLLNKNASLQKSQYKLKGIVYHYGKMVDSGHYISDVYVNALEKWYRMDDQKTYEVNFSPYSETAYLLFYEQCS